MPTPQECRDARQKIVRRVREAGSMAAVARELGVTRETVRQRCKKEGLTGKTLKQERWEKRYHEFVCPGCGMLRNFYWGGEGRRCLSCAGKGKREKGKDPTSLKGRRFGKLVVLRFAYRDSVSYPRSKHYRRFWFCRCDCGNEKVIEEGGLRNNNVRSCGCSRRKENR